LLHVAHTHGKLEVSLFFNWYQIGYTPFKGFNSWVWSWSLCDFYFLITSFIMDFSQLSEENFDIELSKVFDKLSKTSINSNKELKKVKQEKESLIV